MKKEVKRSSIWATRIEVWKFLWHRHRRSAYKIEPQHHLNMLEGKGCSKKALALYLESHNPISEEALLEVLKNKNFDVFKFWAQHAKGISLSSETEKAIISMTGGDILLENKISLSQNGTSMFLRGKNLKKLSPLYVDYLTFSPQTEALLLKAKVSDLTSAYLCDRAIFPENYPLILLYDDPRIYSNFAYHNSLDTLIADIINTKSLALFQVALNANSSLSFDNEKLLIDKDNSEWLRPIVECSDFSEKGIEYFATHASNELFESYIYYFDFDYRDCDDRIYERLFEPRHFDILKTVLERSNLPSKFEIRLIESKNQELIDIYFDESLMLHPETVAWLADHPHPELSDKLLLNVNNLGHRDIIRLFQSGDDKKIRKFINDCTLGLIDNLALFKFASPQIVKEYFSDYDLDIPDQIALIKRNDVNLLKDLWNNGLRFVDADTLSVFLSVADDDTILSYLQLLSENERNFYSYCVSDDCSLLSIILHRKDLSKSAQFFVKEVPLSTVDERQLAALGSSELIDAFLSKRFFYEEAERILLCRGDKEIIRKYISKGELYSYDNEIYLFLMDDWDLIKFYHEKYGFSDDDIRDELEEN